MVGKGQDPPDMGNLSDIPKDKTLARSNVHAEGGGHLVDPHATVHASVKSRRRAR
jgi:hypothetical protein